jgi:small subunit ribosomal protein S15
MTITKQRKQEIIKEYQTASNDTGSPETQVAILTERIKSLTEHMRARPKDYSTRRGLLGLVSRRRRLLNFLRRVDAQRYLNLIERLDIRK